MLTLFNVAPLFCTWSFEASIVFISYPKLYYVHNMFNTNLTSLSLVPPQSQCGVLLSLLRLSVLYVFKNTVKSLLLCLVIKMEKKTYTWKQIKNVSLTLVLVIFNVFLYQTVSVRGAESQMALTYKYLEVHGRQAGPGT